MTSLKPVRRIACLWFPDWCVQRLLAHEPAWSRSVLLIVTQTKRGELVVACNDTARNRDIVPGLPVSEARSRMKPGDALHVEPVRADLDRDALMELARRCEAYSPHVGLEEGDQPESLFLDLSGVSHLFGDEVQLAQRIDRDVSATFRVRMAVADSVGGAWAAARCLARTQQPAVISPGRADAYDTLPVEALRLESLTVGKLHRLGVRTIGQLRNLNRSTLPSRFGENVIVRLDQLTGERKELLTPCRPRPRFRVGCELEEALSQPDRIEYLWWSLLQDLMESLQSGPWAVRRLECQFITEATTRHDVILRFCEPLSAAEPIRDLLRLRLERLRWDAALVAVWLEAFDLSPLACRQEKMFAESSPRPPREFVSLLNRLTSRLGQEAVVRAALTPDPVPERSVEWAAVAVRTAPAPDWHSPFLPFDRPTGIFPVPCAVDVVAAFPDGPPGGVVIEGQSHSLRQCWGPDRIESGGAHGPEVRRDYYRVETMDGRRLWLFRRLEDGRWFLQGEML